MSICTERMDSLRILPPKIPEGQTQCTNCKKEFKTEKALWSHGSPEVCKERLKKNYAELTCEYCGKKWVGYIGRASGKGTKFCSTKCMGESNRKTKDFTCIGCGEVFQDYQKSDRKYCDLECFRENCQGWKVKDSSRMGGPRPGGGYSKLLPYTNRHGEMIKLNASEIELAEYLDSLDLLWERNMSTGFIYTDLDGDERRFYPDFYIPEKDLYIEFKGWLTDKMRHKMNEAERNNPDLNLLIVVGRDGRFLDDGISIEDLENGEASIY